MRGIRNAVYNAIVPQTNDYYKYYNKAFVQASSELKSLTMQVKQGKNVGCKREQNLHVIANALLMLC